MISCPICNQEQMVGTVFCGNCGNLLTYGERLNKENHVKRIIQESTDSTSPGELSTEKRNSWLSLYFLDNGEILSLPDKDEITIGRTSEDQPILPDIDLSRFKAFENGVSRLHCVLKKIKTKTFVKDLGSSNGTTLNGFQIDSNSNTSFKHGDMLSLGKLKFQLLLHQDQFE